MPVVDLSPYKPVPATLGDANQIASGFQLIQTILNGIDNANFAAGKIFDPTKIMQNGALQGQGLVWDSVSSTWKPGGAAALRKSTPKAATNTVTETDLLNGEFTLPAGALGTTGMMRLTAWGDAVYTAGVAQAPPRFKFKVGAGPTVILDTNTTGPQVSSLATRWGWRIVVEWMNLGATNAQWATITAEIAAGVSATTNVAFATGEGAYLLIGATSSVMKIAGGGASAVDTTVALPILLTVINGSAVSTEVKLYDALVEVI